ncbi:group III truncated hemoglobin [Leekyejoonella antrihumi]|uniref:Group III truncated hemoglobin n=1 Tax=Leekyejoonella antrihumi TaxID=1660198 RepID=A0A563E5V6_9MICO|nr:group III truncated hemoglobin [Leekyejoonella antrihumi]TWP37602.1 group III truncated hemoglobin [Leekyejoonella antrihumi]
MDEPSDLQDLAGREDILALLEDFYGRAFADPVLAPIFQQHMSLERHLPIVTDFWATTLLGERSYTRKVIQRHQQVDELSPFEPRHFERWLQLWWQAIDDHAEGRLADLAKRQGMRMAAAMCRAIVGEVPEGISELLTTSGHRVRG